MGLLVGSSCNIFLELCSKRNQLDYFHFIFITHQHAALFGNQGRHHLSAMPMETVRTGLTCRRSNLGAFSASERVVNIAVFAVSACLVFCPAGVWKLVWVGTTWPCVCLESARHTMGWWKRQGSSGLWLCLSSSKRSFTVASVMELCLSVYVVLSQQGLSFLWAGQTHCKQLSCSLCVKAKHKMSLL